MFKKHSRILTILLTISFCIFLNPEPVTPQAQQSPPTPEERATLLWDAPLLLESEPDLDSNNLTPLFRGNQVVFQSYRDNNWEIYRLIPDYNTLVRVTNHPSSDIQPRVNRGATQIIFASNRDGDYEIYRMNLDGSNVTQLTFNDYTDNNIAWSPDGSQIAYTSFQNGQAELYTMDASGNFKTRLTNNADYDGMPSWSPDGSQIAYVSERSTGYFIYVMNQDGSAQTKVSQQPDSYYPAWSPLGDYIAYSVAGSDGWFNLWLMKSDGSNQHVVYDPSGQTDIWVRAWVSDNSYVAYSQVDFIYSGGNWYWTDGQIHGWNIQANSFHTFDNVDLNWNPDLRPLDAFPPETELAALPIFSRVANATIGWSAPNEHPDYPVRYDVQTRVGSAATWQNWINNTFDTQAVYNAVGGTTVEFRGRGRDGHNNLEPWPLVADAYTTFSTWRLEGKVTDNRGTPLSNVPLVLAPTSITAAATDPQGHFLAWLKTNGANTLQLSRAGYLNMPSTSLHSEADQRFYLAPQDNLIQNGGFESSATQLPGWSASGAVTVSTNQFHTGSNSAVLGTDCPFPCLGTAETFNAATGLSTNMKIDSQGNLHVVWQDGQAIYYRRRPANSTWDNPVLITSQDSVFDPVLAIDQNDHLYLVYYRSYTGVYYQEQLGNGTWTSPLRIATENYAYPIEDMVVAEDGTIFVLTRRHLIERTSSGNWLFPTVPHETGNYFPHSMALSPDGTLHFVWTGRDVNINQKIYYRARYSDGLWSKQISIHTPTGLFLSETTHLVAMPDGTLHFLWHEDYVGYWHMRRTVEGIWSSPVLLASLDHTVSVGADAFGYLYMLSSNNSAGTTGFYLRRWSASGGWSAPNLLTSALTGYPTLTVADNGMLHFLWIEYAASISTRYQQTRLSPSATSTTLSQSVTLSGNIQSPTLAFMAKALREWPGDNTGLQVTVSNGISTTIQPINQVTGSWSLHWVDLAAWSGETVTITFQLQQEAGSPPVQLMLDDISLGSAYPDLRLTQSGPGATLPGNEVVLRLAYSNQGGVLAQDSTLTVALPAGIHFVSATVTPAATSPALLWNLGDLPANSSSETIWVTLAVDNNVAGLSTLTTPITLATTTQEREVNNNTLNWVLLVAHQNYLPFVRNP